MAKAKLRMLEDHETTRGLHPKIAEYDGKFDYLFATNRGVEPNRLGPRQGYFVLRGIELS